MNEPIKILVIVSGSIVSGIATNLASPGQIDVCVEDLEDDVKERTQQQQNEIDSFRAACPNWIY